MKLTYRGQAYESFTSNPIDSAASSQPAQVKLIYRGQTYWTTPRPTVTKAASAAGSVLSLIYRGAIYQQAVQTRQPYSPARVVSWRYQIN